MDSSGCAVRIKIKNEKIYIKIFIWCLLKFFTAYLSNIRHTLKERIRCDNSYAFRNKSEGKLYRYIKYTTTCEKYQIRIKSARMHY